MKSSNTIEEWATFNMEIKYPITTCRTTILLIIGYHTTSTRVALEIGKSATVLAGDINSIKITMYKSDFS